jgi:hypothetical protein
MPDASFSNYIFDQIHQVQMTEKSVGKFIKWNSPFKKLNDQQLT